MLRIILGVLAATALHAQSSATAIQGLVKDSSGAVVPGALVTATHTGTNQIYRSTTTGDGYYQIPLLPVGTFDVDVSFSGFKKSVQRGLLLQVDEKIRVDFTLEPGAVSESVTVQASGTLVDTSGATLKQVIDSHRMTELPLNGRSMLELQLLSPGVVSDPTTGGGLQSPTTGFSVNGGRASTVNYLLDGGDNNDYFFNTASNFPIPDAVQEFSMSLNNFTAEQGKSSGGVVNVITRSGTNVYHGGLFEFLRNDALNTRNFFSASVPKLRQNQFGGVFGGPLSIPKLYAGKDRTFFFLSYQATRIRSGLTQSNIFVPTALERNGDYAASTQKPTDPNNRQAFPGSVIPASRLDPIAKTFIERFVPLPNLPGGQYSFNNDGSTDVDQGLLRIDHSFSNSHKFYARSFTQHERRADGGGLPEFRNWQDFRSWNASAGDSLILRPTLVNSFSITMNRTQAQAGPVVSLRWRDLGVNVPIAGPVTDPTNSNLTVSNAFQMSTRNAIYLPRTVVHLSESLSYTSGSHFWKFGFEGRGVAEIRRVNGNIDGNFTFSGQFSGVPVADFQLGRPSRYVQSANTSEGLPRQYQIAWFVQDDWKITPRLTLNIGLRLEPFLPIVDQHDQRPAFRPGQKSTQFPNAPAGLVYAGDTGIDRGIVSGQWNHFAPRFGFAYDPFGRGKTSIRGAYGIFWDMPGDQYNYGFGNPPFVVTYTVNAPASFRDPYAGQPTPVIPYLPPRSAAERGATQFARPVPVASLDAGFTNSYMQQFNFSVEHEIASNMKLTVAYAGAKGTHLAVVHELNAARFNAAATVANTDTRRPFAPDFQSVTELRPAATSIYNALQATVNRRFARGFTLLASYSWAKGIDTTSINTPASSGFQNPNDLRSDRGPSDTDITHSVTASSIWEIPWFRHQAPLLRGMLAGWQLAGITRLRSGLPFSVTSGRDNSLTAIGRDRPNVQAATALPGDRSRSDTINEYFNRAAFVQNPNGTFGVVGRNTMRGPGASIVDVSLAKNFRLGESLRLTYRAEAFNAFNNVNFGNPAASLLAPNFARLTSASGSRVWQMALKMNW
ncbi:MAG: TonB-dependent receptor [Candidatus Solibacter usitatus]|nr:TonB-dependent receptor [Candidatus Solibacter usitatus]